MKKKPEKNWELESGFELRKVQDFWCIYGCGILIEAGYPSKDEAAKRAKQMDKLRKNRNEQA